MPGGQNLCGVQHFPPHCPEGPSPEAVGGTGPGEGGSLGVLDAFICPQERRFKTPMASPDRKAT